MMPTLLTSCPYDQLSLEQLSDQKLLARRARNQQVGFFILMLIVLTVGMAFVLESYLVAVAGWGLIPAVDDYTKKRKAINLQLQKRHIA
ncbi:hypothetical protein [Spirosoma radiotolerans]|uniref:Uncharacterized protein n=1 Tax=Spirosoma radiotolerans TaxID=1379870 RepID=A0A0E3ZWF7_9BACT|nr:hypothetical protein [Spirosoma radiotolerans]AKD55674.1 hypothetical protein SD10_12965 [Spirosoma radiotolerans]